MVTAAAFLEEAKHRGFDFFTGVPCSFLTPLINRAITDPEIRYVGATNEGEAIAIASGAWLAGRSTVVMCQNSGLGNAVNPLTSLNWPFRIPTLLVVTLRGEPGIGDEPQHELMGQITARLLDDIKIANKAFPNEATEIPEAFETACREISTTQLPFAFLMRKGTIDHEDLVEQPRNLPPPGDHTNLVECGARPTRFAALETILALAPEHAAVIATTGKCGRELFTLADRPQHLYQVGSMGCASAMSLGVALNVDRPVLVLDGDGAALMKLGSFATIGAQAPKNLTHIILDNGVHDSTGGQATVSESVDFGRVALACGYRHAVSCDSLEGLQQVFSNVTGNQGPCLIHIRIKPGSMTKLGRPTIKPSDVARRFRDFVTS